MSQRPQRVVPTADWKKKTVTVVPALPLGVASTNPTQSKTDPSPSSETPTTGDFSSYHGLKGGEGYPVEYDALVVAVGCYSASFGIPGVRTSLTLAISECERSEADGRWSRV